MGLPGVRCDVVAAGVLARSSPTDDGFVTPDGVRFHRALVVGVVSSNAITPVRTMAKEHGDALYVFSAAMYDEATVATFTVAELEPIAAIEVLGESRTLAATNGVFSDAFEPNDVHIYKTELKKSGFMMMLK